MTTSAVRRIKKILVTENNINKVMDHLDSSSHLVIDTETTGLYTWHGARQCGICVCRMEGGPGFYAPFRHGTGKNLPDKYIEQFIHLISTKKQTGWNYKFDIHMLMADGLPLPSLGQVEDVMLAAHLFNENERYFGLKYQASRYIDPKAAEDEEELSALLKSMGYGKGDMWRLSAKQVRDYAASDVILTRALRKFYEQHLRHDELWTIWLEINDYALATVEMEQRGIKLDMERLKKYQQEAVRKEKRYLKRMAAIAGYDINPNSSKQICHLIGLKSSAKDVLEAIPNPGPEIEIVLKYRQWSKVNSTYYNVYEEKRDVNDVLHPNIKLHGTISGRPSAEDPNLQAIPRRTDVYKVKDILIARPGYLLVSADYSQAELRFAAWLADEINMIEILNQGGDIHQSTADKMGIDRDPAKRINFGVVYGLGAPGLAERLGIELEEAQSHMSRYHTTFPQLKVAYTRMQAEARREDYIRMWTGRMRRYNNRGASYHKALSNAVQGGVAEIMRHTILKINRLRRVTNKLRDVHMLLQVHDQILFEIPNDSRQNYHIRTIKSVMEDFPQFNPSPKVDIKVGTVWGTNLKEWGQP